MTDIYMIDKNVKNMFICVFIKCKEDYFFVGGVHKSK